MRCHGWHCNIKNLKPKYVNASANAYQKGHHEILFYFFKRDIFSHPLCKKFNITKVPTLMLLNADSGEILQENARMLAYYKENDCSIVEKFPFKDLSWKIVHKVVFN